ncbi:hypothetical protein ACMT1E_10685 [Sphingomonas flavalba]|uniref:hypothetical protein n=1 Tax=Sphingomonas flavalba TaxID=2559804 RepID=UPI0039E0675E
MRGWSQRMSEARAGLAPLLVVLALLLRVMIPAGWMPMAGGGYAITLCTGMGAVSAWVDADGQIHKDKPPIDSRSNGHCIFAGFAAALTLPDALAMPVMPMAIAAALLPVALFDGGAIGRGLAAPPPPPTGPPHRL